jgi:hypothetical protein
MLILPGFPAQGRPFPACVKFHGKRQRKLSRSSLRQTGRIMKYCRIKPKDKVIGSFAEEKQTDGRIFHISVLDLIGG